MSLFSLDAQAEGFAAEMTHLLLATVTNDAQLEVVRLDVALGTFFVGNRLREVTPSGEEAIRTLRGTRIKTALECVEVAVNWRFIPNSAGIWLKTAWSQFGLYVHGAPLIRLEVDPDKGGHDSWLAAHIQVTAESSLLGYIWGAQGKKRRALQKLHLPVGGFRYRPGVEDFLEFAIDEGLIPGKPGWKDVLNKTRESYRIKQLHSLVQKFPDIAQEALDQISR